MTKKKNGYRESELPGLLQSMAVLGFVVVFCVSAFFVIGYLLDKYLGLGVAAMIVATFLGAVVAIYWAYRRVVALLEKIYRDEMAEPRVGEAAEDEESSSDDEF